VSGGPWGTVLSAMVTPFAADGSLDLDVAVQLARWLADHGHDGLVLAGTTGESPTLTDAEKLDLWRAVSEAVTIPVVAGAGSNDTAHTVELSRRAREVGAAGVLIVGPYYNRPPQAGLEAHFRAAAAATDLPVMVYDVPIRTGRRVSTDVLLRVFREVPNIVAFKDATGDPAATAGLVAELGDTINVYSGDDSLTLPLLSVGAVGVVGVATHWSAPEHQEMIAAFLKGDIVQARQVNARLLESWAYETGDLTPNPLPTKAMLRTLGLPAGQARLPMGEAPDGLEDRAREVYANLH
jgi:4-hydroxy-tetrahydrodipicolinate synthase